MILLRVEKRSIFKNLKFCLELKETAVLFVAEMKVKTYSNSTNKCFSYQIKCRFVVFYERFNCIGLIVISETKF